MEEKQASIIAYPNVAADAIFAEFASGDWRTALPLVNLLGADPGYPARSTDTDPARTRCKADLRKVFGIRVVWVAEHNLSLTGRYRYRLWDDSGYAVVSEGGDSGWRDAWPTVYTPDQLEWEDDEFWFGTLSDKVRANYPGSLPWVLPATVPGQYLTIEIDDQENPDTVIDLYRLMVATQFQPVIDCGFGYSIGWKHRTDVAEAWGGVEYFQRRSKTRRVRCAFDWLTEDEAMGKVFDMQADAGVDGDVLYIYNPLDTLHMLRRSFLCRFDDETPPVTFRTFDAWRAEFPLKEKIV